ncbi:hypothetical protein REPUB_Repub10bG0156000 [Reevesia pubescens]
MASTLGCSATCKDIRNPIKLSSGCSTERYLMRQRYLRSYPLMMTKKEDKLTAGNISERTKKWLKAKLRKYYRRVDDDDHHIKQTDKKSKPHNLGSSYVKACLKLVLVCVAKVDDVTMENPKPAAGFGRIKKI